MAQTPLFTDITEVNLDNSFVTNLNQQLANIDSNFKKLLSLPLVKGDKGDGVGVGILRTYNEVGGQAVLTELGKKIIQQIYVPYSETQRAAIDYSLENDGTLDDLVDVLRDIEINGTDSDFEPNVHDFQATSINIDNFPQEVKIYYQRHSEEVTQQETTTDYTGVSVGYVFHFDGRLSDIAEYENELAVNFIDTSCALMVQRVDGEIVLDSNNEEVLSDNADILVMRCSIIPTLYFDGTNEVSDRWSNTFCWMINGRRTGITAQGIKGDRGDSVRAYICSGILNDTFITIDSVLSPQDISVDDVPTGSLAFVWFLHNDGIPSPTVPPEQPIDIQSLASVVDNDTPSDVIQYGTQRYVALDLTVGVVWRDANNQPRIDYNVNYAAAPYLSLANIFQSCILYNEMLRINKYPYVAKGLFVPDNDVRYEDTYYTTQSLRGQQPYHLFGSFRNTHNELPENPTATFWSSRVPYAYIGVANINDILTTSNGSMDNNYWDVYRFSENPTFNYNINQLGILKSLYRTFVMHDFMLDIRNSTPSVLTNTDAPGHPFQTVLSLGDYDSTAHGGSQAAIKMYAQNREVTSTGETHMKPNYWGTANISDFQLTHGNFAINSDPYPPSGYGQNVSIKNPYIKILAETERYYQGYNDKQTTDTWQNIDICGYNMKLTNMPSIVIAAHNTGQQSYSWPFYTHKIQPRITVSGDANLSSTDISNYIHINQMKCKFDVSNMSEDANYERVVEIMRDSNSNYVYTATNSAIALPMFNNLSTANSNSLDPDSPYASDSYNTHLGTYSHYKLGFQCTNTSVLLLGDSNYKNYTILHVKNGAVRFNNDFYVGSSLSNPADNIKLYGKEILIGSEQTSSVTLSPRLHLGYGTNPIQSYATLSGGTNTYVEGEYIYIGKYGSNTNNTMSIRVVSDNIRIKDSTFNESEWGLNSNTLGVNIFSHTDNRSISNNANRLIAGIPDSNASVILDRDTNNRVTVGRFVVTSSIGDVTGVTINNSSNWIKMGYYVNPSSPDNMDIGSNGNINISAGDGYHVHIGPSNGTYINIQEDQQAVANGLNIVSHLIISNDPRTNHSDTNLGINIYVNDSNQWYVGQLFTRGDGSDYATLQIMWQPIGNVPV